MSINYPGWPIYTTSDADGRAVIEKVNEGAFTVSAAAEDLTGEIEETISRDEVLEVTVRLEPAGSITGTIYEPDGVTPVENVIVRILGNRGWLDPVITEADGVFLFEGLPILNAYGNPVPYRLEAYERGELNAYGTYVGGQLRACIEGVVIETNGQIVTQDLTLIGLGTVQGRVLMPDSSSAGDMPVTVRSLTPVFGKTWSVRTDAAGYYTVERVPVGDIIVTSGNMDDQLWGEGEGKIINDGDTITVDIILENNAITLPLDIFDANHFRFDIQEDGTTKYGQNSVFRAIEDLGIRGGATLAIVADSTEYTFDGGEIPTQEDLERELVTRQNDLAGLNITRKIYVPLEGYFARYLEILTNPTSEAITVDILVKTGFNDYQTEIITTSSGDDIIQVDGTETSDQWVVLDEDTTGDVFIPTYGNKAPAGLLWSGPEAAHSPETVEFMPYVSPVYPNVTTRWNSVTVPPGESAAFMHFVVQHASREAAQASVERLVHLPPEAIAGLSISEMQMVQNFAIPEDGSSSLEPLPHLTAQVTGQVWASDETTQPDSGTVYFKSDNIYFSRTYTDSLYNTGSFEFIPELEGNPAYTPIRGIPPDSFTVWARIAPGGGQDYVYSPEFSGDFQVGQTTVNQDIVFTNTGILLGTVKQATDAMVSDADVEVDMTPYFADDVTEPDGSYLIAFLPQGDYTVTAEERHNQGFPNSTTTVVAITEGLTAQLDITMPPLGDISGVVTGPDGSAAYNALVELRETEGDYFRRQTRTDTGGQYTLTDVPVGTYTLTAFDPATNGPFTITVTVNAEQTLAADYQMPEFVTLPINLYDGDGFLWDIQYDGRISYGTDNAYTNQCGLDLIIGASNFAYFTTAVTEEDGQELLIGPYAYNALDDVTIRRKIFVPNDDGFARYLEIVENNGSDEVTVQLRILTYLGSGSNTQVLSTSSGDTVFNTWDRYIVTDDDGEDGSGTPTMVHVVSGDYAEVKPAEITMPASYYIATTYDVTVPAGERRIIMHFASQNTNCAAAFAKAEQLRHLDGSALVGLSADEQADIINFVAYVDSDRDGLPDIREDIEGTNSDMADTDEDGLLDGFEVLYGYNPLSDLGEGALDPDNDGLNNIGEQNAMTDPFDPDTDAGGQTDGIEVNDIGTDPLNPDDDMFDLPMNLYDANGFLWDIQRDGRTLNGIDNAYYGTTYSYGGLDLFVNSSAFPSFAKALPEENRGRELAIGQQTLGDLLISRKVFVPDDDLLARYLEILENTNQTEDMTATVRIESVLGSTGNTQIVSTSNGDQVFNASDNYIITDDNEDGTGTPTMVHVFSGAFAEVEPASVLLSGYRILFTFEVTIPAGERRIIMHFASQNSNQTIAAASADALHCLAGKALYGLSPEEQADIVNFSAYIDTDCDGLSDDKETLHGTDPNLVDTDGDGLTDGEEVNAYYSNPLEQDTDEDGLLDAFEVYYGFNPLVTGEQNDDPDSDGLDNLAEQEASTDPTDSDTDDDELIDGDEINIHGTDPLNPDSDGGGRTDGREVLQDGTNPLDGSDDLVVIRLSNGTGSSDQAMTAVDSQGNIHVVWSDNRTGNYEIFYTMLSLAGDTLIDDTQLTSKTADSRRPAIVIDSQGRAHIAWHDKRFNNTPEIFYTIIDPALDDQDGSSGDDSEMAVIDDFLISISDSNRSNTPRLTIDSLDCIHMVWSETDNGEVRYAKLELDGTETSVNVLVSKVLFSAGGYRWYPALPAITLDSQENVHVVWLDHREMSTVEIFYEMLNGATGATLIDETVLTVDDGHDSLYPSIATGPGDVVSVVYGDLGLEEIFMLRINPALDDQDGSSAAASEIIVLPATVVSPNDGVASVTPTGVVDSRGNIRITYYDNWENWSDFPGTLNLRIVDRFGATIDETLLTDNITATTLTDWTLGFVAVNGITSYVTWTDNRYGNPKVLLRIINPDTDRDGLANSEERAIGTDSNNPDTDGG